MFISKPVSEYRSNPFEAIGDRWMLITAGDERVNAMTASWGGIGIMWNKPAAICFIRPQRFTRGLIDDAEYFSLCFFAEGEQREALALCGRESGRDMDKIAAAGLTVVRDNKAPYFAEASEVFICRKLFKQALTPESFIDPEIDKHYAQKDYHFEYIGEIVDYLVKE